MKNFNIHLIAGNLSAAPRSIDENGIIKFSVWSIFSNKEKTVFVNGDVVGVYDFWGEENKICKGSIKGISDRQLFILMLQFRDEFLEIEKRSGQEYNLIYEKLTIISLLNDSQISRKRKIELKKCLDNIEFELLYYTDKDIREAIDEVNRIAPNIVLA